MNKANLFQVIVAIVVISIILNIQFGISSNQLMYAKLNNNNSIQFRISSNQLVYAKQNNNHTGSSRKQITTIEASMSTTSSQTLRKQYLATIQKADDSEALYRTASLQLPLTTAISSLTIHKLSPSLNPSASSTLEKEQPFSKPVSSLAIPSSPNTHYQSNIPTSLRAASLPASISSSSASPQESSSKKVDYFAKQMPSTLMIMMISSNPKPNIYPYTVYSPGKVTQEKCPSESNCFITHDIYDRKYDNRVDVFIIQRPYNIGLLNQLKTKHPNSSLVFMNQESPSNTVEHFGPEFDNRFTFTATYKKDSDIVTPYYDVLPLQPGKQAKELTDYAKNKTELIVTFMSNCVSYRMKFINSLNAHVPVSLFGRCQRGHSKKCARFDPSCEKYQKSFKFYLALENSFCTDYVTEKMYFQGLEQGLVPVVLNRGKLDDPTVAPPKSFINILDFKSTKELADYLLYLDKNDTAYNEYHQWRQKYVVKEHDYVCNTCKRLWELKREGCFGKNTVKLGEFYSRDRNCVSYNGDTFMKYLK